MNQVFWSTIVTIFLAFLGYLATYLNNLRLSQRKDKLDRINRQLSDLYGPMYSLTYASNMALQGYFSKHSTVMEATPDFRLWMNTVFMPINMKFYDSILTKSDLLIETEMPECLLSFCVHVTAYQAVLEKWKNNDFSEYLSVVEYPKDLGRYAQESYAKLKAKQAKLLGNKG